MAVASGHLNSTGVLLEVGGVLPMIHGGEMQQTPNTVAASPAASGKSSLFHYILYFRDVELGIDGSWFLAFVTKQLSILDFKPNLEATLPHSAHILNSFHLQNIDSSG